VLVISIYSLRYIIILMVIIIGRTLTAITKAFLLLERESRKMGLIINGDKTKYAYMFAGQTNDILPLEISINGYLYF
jgi:hypothetical protein